MDWVEANNLKQRAWSLIEIDRYQEAIPLFTRALEYDPDSSHVLCGLSTAFYYLKDWDRALQYAERAVLADRVQIPSLSVSTTETSMARAPQEGMKIEGRTRRKRGRLSDWCIQPDTETGRDCRRHRRLCPFGEHVGQLR